MKSITKPIALTSLGVIIAAGGTIAGLELSNTTHWFHKGPNKVNVITQAGNLSGDNKPKPAGAGQPPTNKTPTTNTGQNIGGASDTGGQTTTPSSGSQPITSASGNITVDQPSPNATISNGATLSGTATVSQVQFNLIDNNVGLIARGTLNVVNGKYSGTLNFNSSATSGRLDVFSTEPNGRQINEVEIAVKF